MTRGYMTVQLTGPKPLNPELLNGSSGFAATCTMTQKVSRVSIARLFSGSWKVYGAMRPTSRGWMQENSGTNTSPTVRRKSFRSGNVTAGT